MSTIKDALTPFIKAESTDWDAVEAALIEREDTMCDLLRLAGAQFGLYPEIVAEVLAGIGLGRQPSEPERIFIREQFVALMDRLRREHEGNN